MRSPSYSPTRARRTWTGRTRRAVPGARVGVVEGLGVLQRGPAGGLGALAVERAAGERRLGRGGAHAARPPAPPSAIRAEATVSPSSSSTAATVTIEAEFSRRRIALV